MINFNKNNCEFIFRNLDSMSICQYTHWEEIAKLIKAVLALAKLVLSVFTPGNSPWLPDNTSAVSRLVILIKSPQSRN